MTGAAPHAAGLGRRTSRSPTFLFACLIFALGAQNAAAQFALYTGTPTVPEAAAGFAGPSGFQVSVCPVSRCGGPAWQGYRPLGDLDPVSAEAFAKLGREFGAAYLKAPPEKVSTTVLVPFEHSSRELGTRSILTGRGTLSTKSQVILGVTAGSRKIVVMVGYRAINQQGKVYAVTGASQIEAQRNFLMFMGSARL
jgi:hypothetical protein